MFVMSAGNGPGLFHHTPYLSGAIMAAKDYIPNSDANFSNWFSTFKTYALANLVALGISTGDSEAIDVDSAAFDAAYTAHLTELQTAKVKTEQKTLARKQAVALVRKVVKILQANPAVTDAQRLALGIPVRKTTKTPVSIPATRPLPEIEQIQEFTHTLRITDSESNKAAKPEGVDCAEVWLKIVPVGGAVPSNPSEFTFAGPATSSRVKREFSAEDAGKTAFYRLRWINTRGEAGDWGPQVAATIAA